MEATPQNQTNGLVKSGQPMSAFTITPQDGAFVVTLGNEWIGNFTSEYGAKLHVACIAA